MILRESLKEWRTGKWILAGALGSGVLLMLGLRALTWGRERAFLDWTGITVLCGVGAASALAVLFGARGLARDLAKGELDLGGMGKGRIAALVCGRLLGMSLLAGLCGFLFFVPFLVADGRCEWDLMLTMGLLHLVPAFLLTLLAHCLSATFRARVWWGVSVVAILAGYGAGCLGLLRWAAKEETGMYLMVLLPALSGALPVALVLGACHHAQQGREEAIRGAKAMAFTFCTLLGLVLGIAWLWLACTVRVGANDL